MSNRRHLTMRQIQRGFTLIELVIVIVIVAVLTTIALPAYQSSVRKGQRSDAKAGLLAVAGRMEQFMLDRGVYTYDMEDLGYTDDPMVTQEGHYQIDAAACDGGDETTCFVLTATPLDSSPQKLDTECTSFSLDNTGAKTATGSNSERCWK